MFDSVKVSMAIACIWAWLIPHFYIEFMEYRLELVKSRRRRQQQQLQQAALADNQDEHSRSETQTYGGGDDSDENDHSADNTNSYLHAVDADASKALLRGAGAALLIIVFVYSGSALGIALSTRNMDRRADAIVVGLGRIFSAFLFAVFSVEIPKWLGVTYSSQRGIFYKQQVSSTIPTLKELSFRVCWSILGHFFLMYCILLLHFTKPKKWTIIVSTAIGITFGFGVIWAVYVGRTTYKNHTTLIAFVSSFVILISSAAAFSAGCWYIKEVWYEEDIGYQSEYTLITFFGWLALGIVTNYLYYRLTRRKLRAHATDDNSITGSNTTGEGGVDLHDAKSTWRYQSQVFKPPESVCIAASELSKATAHVAVATVKSPFKRAGSTLTRIRSNSLGSKSGARGNSNVDIGSPITLMSRRRAVSEDSRNDDGNSVSRPNRVRTNTAPTVLGTASAVSSLENRTRTDSNTSFTLSVFKSDVSEVNKHKEDSATRVALVPASATETNELDRILLDTMKPDSVRGFDDDLPSFDHDQSSDQNGNNSHSTSSHYEDMYQQNRLFVDVEDVIQEDAEDDRPKVNQSDPTLWFLIKANSCCGNHYKSPPRKPVERLLNYVKWTLWSMTTLLHLFSLVICIGATAQQNIVRSALPGTFELLYPPDYVESTICAWNESSSNGDIRTFDSLTAVEEANYTVIHCGACGACSNWDDLSLQWTTRSNLAALGQECVKQKLWGGKEQDVQDCNEELIGFSEECSRCWTVDQLCAKQNCVFIYIQSLLVNQVSNFNVDPDDITTTTCDEALCGPTFVPCSGATRRRMNIVSDIPRPENQQCTVAKEDWSKIFDHP